MKNVKNFGSFIRELREKHKLTQADIASATGINEKTLRRIELNKVTPRFDTLEELSVMLKEDLILCFIKANSQDIELLEKIKFNIEGKIFQNDFKELKEEVSRLKNLVEEIQSPYYALQFRQYILLIEGVLAYREDEDYPTSMAIFTEGILVSNENFTIERYKDFFYSPMELRLLMNIAFTVNKDGKKEKYLEILSFIMEEINDDDPIYPLIAHNLATAYKRSGNYIAALETTEKGIAYCKFKGEYAQLPNLYYGKGVSEYWLNRDTYKRSFRRAVYLTQLLGLDHLKTSLIEMCKEFYDFDVSAEIDETF